MTKLSNLLSYQQLLRKVPVLEWLPNYQLTYILPDIIAGLTVAMTVIPQGMTVDELNQNNIIKFYDFKFQALLMQL